MAGGFQTRSGRVPSPLSSRACESDFIVNDLFFSRTRFTLLENLIRAPRDERREREREREMALTKDSASISHDVEYPLDPSGIEMQSYSNGDTRASSRGNASVPPPKEQIVEKYQAQLQTVERLARISNGLYSLNWFLGVCALTWASAVILGGLLTELSAWDYYSVSALLLLEAIRLAAATFFGKFATRRLVYRSPNPETIKYDDKDRYLVLALARIVDQAVQLVVLAVSVVLPVKRLPHVGGQQQQQQSDFDGLANSLRIFYSLELLNAAIAVFGVLLSKGVVPFFVTTFSLRRYYDHVVWRGMETGFLSATDFDLLAFAFKTQAEEYRRNLRAPVVYGLYKDLIDYMYAHNRGFDAARVALDSSDHCEQEAAANIVGFWADLEGSQNRRSLCLQTRLLTKLADALDHQESGRAATCSFERLAKCDPEGALEVENQGSERLLVILIKCAGKVVKARKHDKALVFIKTLIHLLGHRAGQEELDRISREHRDNYGRDKLIQILHAVLMESSALKRTVAVAGKALALLGELPKEKVDAYVRRSPAAAARRHGHGVNGKNRARGKCFFGFFQPDVRPAQRPEKEHILQDELDYLLAVLEEDALPPSWKDQVEIRNASPDHTVPTLANSTSSAIAALVIFTLTVGASIAIIIQT